LCGSFAALDLSNEASLAAISDAGVDIRDGAVVTMGAAVATTGAAVATEEHLGGEESHISELSQDVFVQPVQMEEPISSAGDGR
jgi:hypothetical protein